MKPKYLSIKDVNTITISDQEPAHGLARAMDAKDSLTIGISAPHAALRA
jgi:hypothetical protein